MRLRMAMVAMAAMVLSSCWWAGPVLFPGDPADAAPIKPGLYQMWALDTTEPKAVEKSNSLRIVWQPDGSTQWVQSSPGKPDDTTRVVMARLAIPGRDLWIAQTPIEKSAPMSLYSLIEVRAGILWAIPVIDCNETADIVRAAGGEVSTPDDLLNNQSGLGPTNTTDDPPPPAHRDCIFKTRASLDTAIRALLATNPKFTHRLRLKRIGI